MMADLSLNEYLQMNTEDSGNVAQPNPLFSDAMWPPAAGAESTPVNMGSGVGARPKTAQRVKTADLAQQIDRLSREVAEKMRLLENKIEGCKVDSQNQTVLTQQRLTHQTFPVSSQISPVSSQTPIQQTFPVPSQTLTVPSQTFPVSSQQAVTVHSSGVPIIVPSQPITSPDVQVSQQSMRPTPANVTLSDLYQMQGLNDRVQLEMAKLPLVGSTAPDSDRDTFYRQLVQDTVKQASGKLKIKSGLELESQELVRLVVYWPHAFTSELSHCVKNRKATNIDIESFIFGTVNILLMNDGDVSHQEKQARLLLLKHLMYIAVLRGWAQARQLHNCILQGIETKAISWQTSASHLSQLASTGVSSVEGEKDKTRKPETTDNDKIINIICRSYNSENTQNAECAYSKEGRVCNKVHVCLSCAKQGLCFKHPERRCNKRK